MINQTGNFKKQSGGIRHKRDLRRGMYIFMTIFFCAVCIFCTTQTVLSREADAARIQQERYFDALEQEYVQNMRTLLTKNGYSGSGVTMTAVIEENGTREYTVAIHHKRLDRLSEGEKEGLLFKLQQIPFAEDNCTFNHAFI